MYFPPSSWYKFLPQEYLDKNSNVEALKRVMEGISMPVLNPKTGEEDYVDIGLVEKIIVESEYVQNITANEIIKVDMRLSGLEKSNEVQLLATNDSLDLKEEIRIPLQTFEEMLFKAIHSETDQMLEKVEEFKNLTNLLISNLIQRGKPKNNHFAQLGKEYSVADGIGIIRDIKTNQDVGTFEDLKYLYKRNSSTVNFEGIILSGRAFEDLIEKDRYEFSFYSLKDSLIYSVLGDNNSSITAGEKQTSVCLGQFDILIDLFNENHRYRKIALDSQEFKNTMEGIDENHPLYASKYEEYRTSRLAILEESRNKQKQEQIINQFADIDIGS